MPSVPIARGGLRVSKPTSTFRCSSVASSNVLIAEPRDLKLLSLRRPQEVPAGERGWGEGADGAWHSCVAAPIHFRPQRAAHAEQLDEALGLLHAPVGRLRVGGTL